MERDEAEKHLQGMLDAQYEMYDLPGNSREYADFEKILNDHKATLLAALTGSERPEGPGTDLWLVSKDGRPYAAYPREKQADVYASGFSENVQIEKGTWRKVSP